MTLDEPILIDASNIDMSNTVFMNVSNPYYSGDEVNIMEFCFEYPEERIHIISMIKMAVRCGLHIVYHSDNKEAEKWVRDYHEYYKS